MKFKLNKIDLDKFNALARQREYNIYISDLLLDLINSENRYFKDVELDHIQDEFLSRLDCDDDYAFLLDMYFPNGLEKLDLKNYISNPYFKNIKINNIHDDRYSLTYETYRPFESFIYDDFKIDDDNFYLEQSRIGYFNQTYKYITLKENNIIWMAITPNEINTMKKDIKVMKGNIITFGLGLGYFQYMCSLKDEVTSITVIEKDEKIINFFQKNLLPQFPHKEKIHIIHGDAYQNIDKLNNYNYVYVDLYHNPNDGLKYYLGFKKLEKKYSKPKFHYWLEEGLIALVRRCLITLLVEQCHEHLDENYYTNGKSDTDKLINQFYYALRKKEFNSYKEIYELLKEDSLISLIKSLN